MYWRYTFSKGMKIHINEVTYVLGRVMSLGVQSLGWPMTKIGMANLIGVLYIGIMGVI